MLRPPLGFLPSCKHHAPCPSPHGCQSIEGPSGLELVMLSCNAYASSRTFYTLGIKGINTGSLYIDHKTSQYYLHTIIIHIHSIFEHPLNRQRIIRLLSLHCHNTDCSIVMSPCCSGRHVGLSLCCAERNSFICEA